MIDYYSVRFNLTPCCEDATDLLASYLADIDFESFVADEAGVTAYVKAEDYNEDKIDEIINELFPFDTKIEYRSEFMKGEDWNEEWEKHYFKPIIIGDRCVVHSSFHKDIPKAQYDIVIDPKMAFGTGHHSTTNLIISYLLELELDGLIVTDVGTGTAILAILAKMRGAAEVSGIEIDPGAYENAVENASVNDVKLNLICGDAGDIATLPKADLLLANINRNIIIGDLDKYSAGLVNGGKMILSGFYTEDVETVMKKAAQYGFKLLEIRKDNNWAAIMLIKNGN